MSVIPISNMTPAERKAEALAIIGSSYQTAAFSSRLHALTRYQANGGYGGDVSFNPYDVRCLLGLFKLRRLQIKHAQTGAGVWRWGAVLYGEPDIPAIRAWNERLVMALLKVYWKSQEDS